MIQIGPKPIYEPAALPQRTSLLMDLVPGGNNWLDWACLGNTMRFQAADDYGLVVGSQHGLNGTGLLFFPAFTLAIEALASFKDEDLQVIAKSGNCRPPGSKKLLDTLHKYECKTNRELEPVDDWLKKHRLTKNRLFRSLSLHDRLSLLPLACPATETGECDTPSVAVRFAARQAASVAEFVDLCCFGSQLCKQLDVPCDSKLRAKDLTRYYEKLSRIAFPLLYAPLVRPGLNPLALSGALYQAITDALFIGFNTTSAALHCIARNLDITQLDSAEFQHTLDAWLVAMRQHLLNEVPPAFLVAQDGSTYLFNYPGSRDGDRITVQVGRTGAITLSAATRWPVPTTTNSE